MEETLISFETAKLAKQKGFYLKNSSFDTKKGTTLCICKYDMSDKEYEQELLDVYYKKGGISLSADDLAIVVTQSLLQRWLRETHNIDITIPPSKFGYFTTISYWDKNKNSKEIEPDKYFFVYEQALEFALQESLKLLPNKI